MSVEVIEHRTLYRSDRYFAAFPSVVCLPSNEILLGFRRAPDHRWLYAERKEEDLNALDHVHFRSHVALMRFDQNLSLIDDAVAMPMHGEAGDQDANLFVHSSGRLIQHGFLWYPVTIEAAKRLKSDGRSVLMSEYYGAGYIFWGGYVRFSDDEGVSWSDYIELPVDSAGGIAGGPYVKGAVAVRGRMIERADGTLMIAAYTAGERDSKHQETCFFISKDAGTSWGLHDQILAAKDFDLQEPALANWPEGRVTVFHRTRGNDDKLVISSTDNNGEFGDIETVDVVGHPYDPLVLPDGRLLLFYGYRHGAMGVRARLAASIEELASAPEIIIRNDSPTKDTGYPSACVLPDGRVIVVYYMADKCGIRGIEASLLQLSLE